MVELDLGHLEESAPLGLVPQTILERAARVLFAKEDVDCFRVVCFDEGVEANRPYGDPPRQYGRRQLRHNRVSMAITEAMREELGRMLTNPLV